MSREQLVPLEEVQRRQRFSRRSAQPYCILHPAWHIVGCNTPFCKLTGYNEKELLAMSLYDLMTSEWHEVHKQMTQELYQTGLPQRYEKECVRKAGERVPVESLINLVFGHGRNTHFYCAFVTDITSHRRVEEALREWKLRLADIINFLPDATFVIDLNGSVITWNQAIEEMTGVPAEDMLGKGNYEYALPFYGTRRPILIDLVLCSDEQVENNYSFTTKEKNLLIAETTAPCLRGKEAFLWGKATPLYDNQGNLVGAIESIRDLTERKRAQDELQNSLVKLQNALEGVVNALALTAEKKDPYTAGHQRRVAQLAGAIAREMNLTEQQIKEIRLAAMLHDIGKIHLPTDILSKPGQLNEIEMQLIRTHPNIGYEITSSIPFETSVSGALLQHHERWDGSGYPLGLSGTDILLSARILGVADVVEAMASHRPYRPALGIDRALEEILLNRGILYDPEVVDSCLRLFTQLGFEFE
ncbi:MAG: PAS domain S-box protein [Syntrophomonadaceae bacterium]|nr:PAS domain S-box protein [Syntrophomonadaceae bacterium]